MSAVLVSENAPVLDVIDTPVPSDAREMVCAMFTPMAAATETPPLSESSVSAFGVSAESPSPEPPLSCDNRSAKPRWLSTCCVTPLVLESAGSPLLVSSWGAPAALAIAPDELSDDPSAEMLTAPTALIERSVQASTLWLAIVSASATPIAASLPSVSPRALVSADAICDALMCAAPLTASVAPPLR